MLTVALAWMEELTEATFSYRIQYHADQQLEALRHYWAAALDLDPEQIKFQRKSNSSQLRKRTWRSEHGVLTIRVCDTLLRARLQAWIDCLREQWLDSTCPGRSSAW